MAHLGATRFNMRQDNIMRRICLIVLAACGLAGVNTDAGAQVYPSRPVTLVVPWPTGGPYEMDPRACSPSACGYRSVSPSLSRT